jgi:hypothetical protein
VILTSKGAITTNFNVLGLMQLALQGLELTTYWMLSESPTTGLMQPVLISNGVLCTFTGAAVFFLTVWVVHVLSM